METRAYDPERDAAALWGLKERFERELGALGDEEKSESYGEKLTEQYRERYLDWVAWCIERDPDCVTVADDGTGLAGYVFVLPEELAMIWDSAVLNELYVRDSRRASGLADDLMEAAYDCVRGQDLPLERLMLDVDTENGPAGGLYARHGFEPWGELRARDL
ncbi:GNAT family N-acetyltransferase [Halococcus sp. AFM35]|uniref:GNAT family N-acetyltransferase n=1 Tax=Halococcus sp. AFM35 TaxID=3421653 RepID=UPI003EBF8188